MISSEPVPLVIVEGFMSSAGALVWGNFEQHSNYQCQSNGERNRRTIFARSDILSLPPGYPFTVLSRSVGPVSSLHDRACELFYSLVGGQGEAGSIYGLWLSEQLTPKYHVARACGRVRALLS